MPPRAECRSADFDVLALVTSAGSGDALATVISELPGAPPVPLLIGQHLGAAHVLEELLRCQPRWPVQWASTGVSLEPGRLYVGLPSVALEVRPDHRCLVTPLQGGEPPVLPTDRLLTSLAEAYGSRVLAVVLAGEGTDGVAGARAVLEAGGTVLAQRPAATSGGEETVSAAVIAAGAATQALPLRDLGRVASELLTRRTADLSAETVPAEAGGYLAPAHQAFLLALSDVLRSLADPVALQAEACRRLGTYLEVDRAYYVEFDEAAGTAQVTRDWTRDGAVSLAGTHRLSDFGWSVEILRRGNGHVIADTQHSALVPVQDRPAARALQIIGCMGAPLIKEGRLVGALCVTTVAPRGWLKSDVALLQEVGERVWAAVSRARTEEALRESEARLRALVEQIPGGAVFVVDRRLHYVVAQGEALLAAGYRPEDFLGRAVSQAVPPESVAGHEALYRQALAGGKFELEHAVDGRVFMTRGVPLSTVSGDIYAVLAVSYDITERKRIEEITRESERRYRALFTSMDQGYAVVEVVDDDLGQGIDFLFLEVNPAFMKQTGMPYPVGRRATDLLGTPNPRWAQVYSQVARSGEPIRFEETETTLGRTFDFYAFRLDGEGSHRVAVLFTDITERKRVDAALQFSEERFRTTADLVPDLLWESEPDGFTNWYNQRWLDYTGQTFEQATGWGWTDTVHPDDREASNRRYRDSVAAGLPLRQEHRIRQYDGEYRWFVVHTVPLKDAHGRVIRMYGAATDIHALRTMNTVLEARIEDRTQRLADLNSELRTLATVSSEEFSEPLRRLRGFLHLLERRVIDLLDEKTKRYLYLVQVDAQRAERLAEDFKALARLDRRELKLSSTPLTPLLLQVRSDLSPRLIGRTVTWSVDPLPVVAGDAMLLRQAFTELLFHSLSLVPAQTAAQVRVSATAEGAWISILVRIAPVQARETDLVGDGLATARRALQRHSGTLDSELQDGQLCVQIRLPDRRG